MKRIIRRLGWHIRATLARPPKLVAEEIWRLRQLRHAPPAKPGVAPWRGYPLHYRDGAALLGQLNDIFVGRAYDFSTTVASPRIIDCGAHVGVAVLRWRELYPAARITAFEADPVIAQLLRCNLAERGDAQTEIQAAAAWCANGPLRFTPTGRDSGHVDSAGSDIVPACDLAPFCAEPVDLLKLDIEGAEGTVLAHLAATGALQHIRRLVCEWHEWEPRPPRLHSALELLVAAGFIYRVVEAHCLGDAKAPDFPHLAWPGNHLMIYAWRV